MNDSWFLAGIVIYGAGIVVMLAVIIILVVANDGMERR
jgi:Na+-transporting methylmalonyl-CoA/oxaloacetate decarboxylase gamma subunit